eukprot:s634_g7.t2
MSWLFSGLYETFAPKIDIDAFGDKALEALDKLFAFSLIWSLGSSITEASRPTFDQCVREVENLGLQPGIGIIASFKTTLMRPAHPCATIEEGTPFHKIVVPTTDTIRNMFILKQLNTKHFHSLLVGCTGTGKTIAVQEAIQGLEESAWTSLTINMSAMTSSGKTQEIIESKIEKRIKNKYVEGIHMVSAMGPPGGGRAVISARLQSAANNLCFVNPADSQIKRIFMTLASNKLNGFSNEDVKALSEPLTMTTINIYTQVIDGFLPTPEKCHYLFNLRDIAKIFQGIYLADTKVHEQKEQIVRMWIDGGDPDFVFAALELSNPEAEDAVYDYMHDRTSDSGLKRFMESRNEDYNAMFKKSPMSLVMFKEAVEICCKVLRILKQPQGNALLIGVGGSGRHCQTRLASFIAFYKYKHNSFLEDLKKLYELTGVKNQKLTFLFSESRASFDLQTDTEIVEESFLEDVANMLSSGEVPNLFTGDELQAEAKIAQTPEAMYDFFISRVRENLHIVFCMSYIGNNFRDYCRMYPSLVSCTTAIWLLPWPAEALTEVALKFLTEGELEESLRPPVAEIFGSAHTTVMRFSTRIYQEQKRMNYVTPTNYLELVQGYMKMLKDKQKELGAAADKLRNGLSKLDDARVQEEKQKICDVKAKECEELLKVITAERSKADAQQAQVEADSIRIEKEAKETKILADDATRDLEKAMPALDAAVDALEKLDKKSIAEVKAYAKPPEAVMKTMCAVMTVMEKTPSWGQAKTELNDTNFLVRIKTFDKEIRDNIKDTTLRKIEKFTKDSNFTPKLVSNVSLAAGALCQWVHAMKIYAEIYREVEPKRTGDVIDVFMNKLRQAQEKLESKQKQLREANAEPHLNSGIIAAPRDRESELEPCGPAPNPKWTLSMLELKKVQDLVKNLNDQFNSSNNEKETLARTAEELKVKLERAGKLVDGLAGEKVRWTESLGKFDTQQENLFGDCLVSAAFMSYAGPFGAAYRNELVIDEWMASVKEKDTALNENLQKLPADDFSTENGVLVTKSRRFPLMIDPQNQANAWVRKMEESRQLRDIMKSLERAIEFGSPVLLENVGEELDPSLEPILAKNIIDNGGGTLSLKVGDNVLDYNPQFMFYITTKLSNPHYTPEVSTKTTIVNFIVVLDGLTNQLLGVIVRSEDPRLEDDKNRLLFQVAKGRNRLVELENEILRLLAETKGSLLDDLSLIDTLQESKVISMQTTEQVAHAEQRLFSAGISWDQLDSAQIHRNMIKIDGQRENYRPAGLRSAVLYFVLNDLVAIDPMYQFALAAYEFLYIQSIEKSAEKKISVGGVEERIEDLNAFHALAVYKYGCRAIFERHKLLLSLHLCAQVLKYSNDLNETEFSFFLFGGQVFDRSGQPANPSPDWINQSMWDNIVEADSKLESFKGFQTSLEQSLRDWKKWYSGSEPERDNLPGEKLIVVRCIRPDRVLPAVQVFVALKLDQKFVEPPPLDLEAIYDPWPHAQIDPFFSGVFCFLHFQAGKGKRKNCSTSQICIAEDETSCITPLLFVLTPGMDPTGQLRALAISRNVPWQTISLGQGQEPILGPGISLRECRSKKQQVEEISGSKQLKPHFILPQRTDGAEKGFWVLLANCHLCVHWLPSLEKLIEKTFDQNPHEKFRIFLSSSPTPKFPIQLLQNCIKMTTEPPKGENILAMYLDENPTEIPWDAIRYLIAEANYGGRVTEHPDNRVLRSYVTEFFCTAALQPKFQLSSLTTYYIPEDRALGQVHLKDGSLQSYRQYVQGLPLSEPPEAFGQHTNAEISSSLADTDVLMQTMIEVRGGGGAAAGGDIGESVYATSNTLLEKLPENLDWEEVRDRNEADSSPLKEIERYNMLLSSVRSSIKTLQKGIQGLVVISKEQEAVLNSLYAGTVPTSWLFAYPSLKPLSSWMPDLGDRIEQLNTWGFVGRSQGAKWDMNAGCLADADTMALFNPMPIVHFKPVVRKKVSTEGIYQCPLYLYPIRTFVATDGNSRATILYDLGGFEGWELLCGPMDQARHGLAAFGSNLRSSRDITSNSEPPQTLLGLHEPQDAGATLFGLHEPLNEEGYERVRDYGDESSMESFLRRLLQSEKHQLLEIIPCLAEMCCKEKKAFEEVRSILGHELNRGPDSTLGFSETSNSLSEEHTLGMDASTMPLPERWPFEPTTGSACGGFRLHWLAKPVPIGIWLGGRPCAPLRDNSFVVPCGDCGLQDVIAIFKDHEARFSRSFSYWEPGSLESITPSSGAEGAEIKVITSDLGAEISEIFLGGEKCQLLCRPTATEARCVVPSLISGPVQLQLSASNGNGLTQEAAFTLVEALLFGSIGSSLELLDGGIAVRRTTGVNHGVCLSAKPLRLQNMERRFRVRIEEMSSKGGLRTLAVGFSALSEVDLMPSGQVRPKDSSDLNRAWLVGYDRGGALLCSPKSTQKLPPGSWRPATDLQVGSVLEILLRENQIIIYQDCKERARLFVPAEDGPGQNEELHAVMDLQGAVSCISLVSTMDS